MKSELPLITSDRLLLRIGIQEDIPQILKYFTTNKDYLTPYYPKWANDFFTVKYWQYQVEGNLLEFINGHSLKLFIYPKSSLTDIIGTINFTNFVRGAAYFCYVGYSLSEDEQGKGYMTEALKAATNYVFQELNMHRIMANYMPHNQRSGNVLKKLGFVVEGYARDYLLINGQWQDHIMTSLTNPHWEMPKS
ncbi:MULTISPECIES: GNAT family N-acetyltransferase [unclassified Tolypothrix]|uniref:GNAT family N-acetyltransferase n=1 Tax=unclassified Tolypothrix TaxID=2649714 RepID=UPI0005EAAEA6|nr:MULTISPECIES: GNAT family N-acetyltransferase [unclassified Tolypothrix]BAY92188.1 ribosomal-protein-alanine acetyltransferase [Microchaete diplosiphon NIES-3275]EKE98561.1 ribosomal-protein-alanine [Tolypothrix sp. PCC 7601]MBE9086539.1 GNAT family N-acetyltransferase [Tolypothrix sp. LEGE 11397]UYD26165.1 GNAT family N-acetyltransferase [Tolypothrix sp. PCC 7712]UYD31598.1 GNAT family N-acetyltransferase [Tolypothrix sp. PCC 7601]